MPQGPSGYNHQLDGGNGLNNEEENDAVEQAPELTLLDPQLEQTLPPTITTTQDLLLQFPQAEVCVYAENSLVVKIVSS